MSSSSDDEDAFERFLKADREQFHQCQSDSDGRHGDDSFIVSDSDSSVSSPDSPTFYRNTNRQLRENDNDHTRDLNALVAGLNISDTDSDSNDASLGNSSASIVSGSADLVVPSSPFSDTEQRSRSSESGDSSGLLNKSLSDSETFKKPVDLPEVTPRRPKAKPLGKEERVFKTPKPKRISITTNSNRNAQIFDPASVDKEKIIPFGDRDEWFLASLDATFSKTRNFDADRYVSEFKKRSEALLKRLFTIFNHRVFNNKLPDDMCIEWAPRLTKTAGKTVLRRIKNPSTGECSHQASVLLSSKVIDNPARARDTLIHELCHAAVWLIDKETGGHGPKWKAWTYRAMKMFPSLPPISRCHSYAVDSKYRYQCSKCPYSIKRHSKSVDTDLAVCPMCRGKLLCLTRNNDGEFIPVTPRQLTPFAKFVKEKYGEVKSQTGSSHKETMQKLSSDWKLKKDSHVRRALQLDN